MTKTGVMLIHGMLGSPGEFGPLASLLEERSYQVKSLSLPGHGDMRHLPIHQLRTEDLLSHCVEEYELFASQCENVVLVGHSLGGICSLLLASGLSQNMGALRGVVTLSTPFERAYTVNHPHGWFMMPPAVALGGLQYLPDLMDTGFARPLLAMPSPQAWQSFQQESAVILEHLGQRVSQVAVPVCLVHSIYDLTVPYGEMEKLERQLSASPRVITYTLERSGHQIFPRSRDAQRVHELILGFIEETC